MSAFVVSQNHLWYLVRAGECYKVLNFATPTSVGQMLLDENVKSVISRYPDTTMDELFGWPTGKAITYNHSLFGGRTLDAIQVLKAANCYSYQSCEHEGWEKSEAKDFIDSLQSAAIRRLVGYEEADWDID